MIVMVEFTYPTSKVDEVGKAFIDDLQANPIPDYVKLVEVYQSWGGDGIKGHAYYDLAKGNEDEGMKYLVAHDMFMSKAADGYKVQSNVVYPLAEAYEFLGMKAPAV